VRDATRTRGRPHEHKVDGLLWVSHEDLGVVKQVYAAAALVALSRNLRRFDRRSSVSRRSLRRVALTELESGRTSTLSAVSDVASASASQPWWAMPSERRYLLRTPAGLMVALPSESRMKM